MGDGTKRVQMGGLAGVLIVRTGQWLPAYLNEGEGVIKPPICDGRTNCVQRSRRANPCKFVTHRNRCHQNPPCPLSELYLGTKKSSFA